ncbi:AMP-binding protein, partial [Streptomyces sp. NPDC001880]
MSADRRFPLSAPQRGLWLFQQLDPENPVLSIGDALEIRGAVDPAVYRAAIRQVVHEAEALRVRVGVEGDDVFQYLIDPDAVQVSVVDLSGEADPDAAAEAHMAAGFDRAMDPVREPLFAPELLRLAEDRHLSYHRFHHVAVDGWSMGLVARRLAEVYTRLAAGQEPGDSPFSPLSTLLDADTAYRTSPAFAEDAEFWRQYLTDAPEAARLTTGEPSIPQRLVCRSTVLAEPVAVELRSLAAKVGVRTSTIEIAATAAYLHAMTGARELVLGLPVAARQDRTVRSVPGMASNVVPLRLELDPAATVEELLGHVAERTGQVLDHQMYRYEDLSRDLNLVGMRQQLDGPLVNAMNFDYDLTFGTAPATGRYLPLGLVQDLSFQFQDREDGRGWRIQPQANVGLYTAEELDEHSARMVRFLTALASATPDTPLARLGVLLPGERELLGSWQGPVTDAPVGGIGELFAARAAAVPDAVAVEFGDTVLTYAELDARANQVAHWLIEHGVRPESSVGVRMDRSAELVVALLGVAKAGGVYVPFHPQWPAERRDLIHRRAQISLVITAQDITGTDTYPTTAPGVTVLPQQLAYVMFTSGSTGEPKGVAVRHSDVSALALDGSFTQVGDRVLVHSPHSFDASTFELWVPLLNGGRVVVAPPGQIDGEELAQVITSRKVTGLWLTAGLFAVMAEEHPECFTGVRQVWTGGDVVSPTAVRRVQAICPGLVVVNGYGPTETTTFITQHRMHTLPEDTTDIPVGRPLDNMQAYVLDTGLGLVPP